MKVLWNFKYQVEKKKSLTSLTSDKNLLLATASGCQNAGTPQDTGF